jgi:hypothetical protein
MSSQAAGGVLPAATPAPAGEEEGPRERLVALLQDLLKQGMVGQVQMTFGHGLEPQCSTSPQLQLLSGLLRHLSSQSAALTVVWRDATR